MVRSGGYYFGEKKRKKKEKLEEKARRLSFKNPTLLPKVRIIGKKGKK